MLLGVLSLGSIHRIKLTATFMQLSDVFRDSFSVHVKNFVKVILTCNTLSQTPISLRGS